MEGSPPISTDGSPSSERPSQIDSNNATASPPDDPTLEDYQSQRSDQQLNPSSSVSASLEDALSSLSIQHPPPGQMFRSLASIFQASQMHEGRIDLRQQIDGSDIWTILRRADESSSQGARDVPALVAVSGILSQMLWYGSQLLVPAIKVIADASRDESWRVPFGQCGILEFAVAIVASGTASDDLQVHALRVIGNSCADTDENRSIVMDNNFLPVLINLLGNSGLATVAIPVLYNVLCDYEPAQTQANADGMFPALIRVLESGILDNTPTLTYLCQLLELASDTMDLEDSPENTVEVLLRAATKPSLDVENCVALADTAIAHMKVEKFQRHMVIHDLFGVPLRFLIRSYFPKANLSGSGVPPVNCALAQSRESSEEAELSRIRKSIISELSDISAMPEFATNHSSLATPLVESLTKWLSASLPQLQLCSCIVLGNLARSDDVCLAMVSRLSIHRELITILRTNSESQVVHSALGFLRNLALPPGNKDAIGEAGALEALTRFWTSDSFPVVSQPATSVARLLMSGSISNVKRMLTSLSDDPESPASSKTYLSLLFSLYEKSDDTTVKTEIARTVASILRSINSNNTLHPEFKGKVLQRLYNLHPNLADPLGMMVSQSKYPVIRSEGWFAMALMARSQEGSEILQSVIAQYSVVAALEDTIRGEKSSNGKSARGSPTSNSPKSVHSGPVTPDSQPEITEAQRAKDRENVMVLINELLKHQGDDLHDNIKRSVLEELLQAGTRASGE